MNVHGSAHLPVVPAVAFVAGLLILALMRKDPTHGWQWELGRSLLWGGAFAALFASSGAC